MATLKALLPVIGLVGCVGWTVTKLDLPPLDKIGAAISTGLKDRYEDVHVQILKHPPNLKEFGWMLSGLGTPTLLDVGNASFLKIANCHNSTYNMTEIAQTIPEIKSYLPGGAWYGAAAAYRPLLGVNGELLGDAMLDASTSFSWGALVDDAGDMKVKRMNTDGVGPFGSLFVTDGASHPVIHVIAKGLMPSDEERFDWAIQKALTNATAELGTVGLAGVVRLLSGSVTFHVMKDFTYDHDITVEEFKAHYEAFYDGMQAPLECATRIFNDATMFDDTTKGAHTHCRSHDLRHLGHYENDTVLPEKVLPHWFEAYLVPAVNLVRVPESTYAPCNDTLAHQQQQQHQAVIV